MANVEIDSNNLKSNCILKLSDAIDSVDKTLKKFDYFDIPYDFSMKKDLINMKNELSSIKNDLNCVKNWIYGSSANYASLISTLSTQANSMPTYRIKNKNNIM